MFRRKKYIISVSILFVSLLLVVSFIIIWIGFVLIRSGEKTNNKLIEKDVIAIAMSYNQSFQQLYASNEVEERLLKAHILTIAHLINRIDIENDSILTNIALENNLSRIDILDSLGRVRYSSSKRLEVPYYPGLKFLISGRRNEIIIWNTESSDTIIGIPFRSYKLAAIKTEDNGAIVVYIDEGFVNSVLFYSSISRLAKEVGTSPGIAFIALQKFEGIVSASGKVDQLSKIESDSFVQNVIMKQELDLRNIEFKSENIIEVVSPLSYDGIPWGVLRIGVYLSDYHEILTGYKQRIFFLLFFFWISILLIIVITILLFRYLSIKKELTSKEYITNKLVDSANYGIIVVNSELQLLSINNFGKELFGFGSLTIDKIPYKKIFTKDELFIEKTWIFKREIKDYMKKIKLPNSKEEEFLIDTIILQENNLPIGVVAFLKEFKVLKIEKELEIEKDKFKEISKMSLSIAHELKNPLNGISLAAQRLKNEFNIKDNKEINAVLELLFFEVKNMEKKISNLLLFSKPIGSFLIEVNLSEIIRELKNSYPEILISADEEDIYINSEKNLILRMFENLIDNSKKARSSKIYIYLKKRNSFVEIIIKDNGIGIAKKYLKDIFKPYFSTSPSGSGLGLYIVENIVEKHNGEITINSEENVGTEIIILLKLK